MQLTIVLKAVKNGYLCANFTKQETDQLITEEFAITVEENDRNAP